MYTLVLKDLGDAPTKMLIKKYKYATKEEAEKGKEDLLNSIPKRSPNNYTYRQMLEICKQEVVIKEVPNGTDLDTLNGRSLI